MADDEQLAELLVDNPPEVADGERWSEWSPLRGDLAVIADRLGELIRISVAAAGGKPPKIRPMPRPRSAIDRVRQRRRMEQHRKIVARMLPHASD